jgi:DNA-binding winged helix-turn-helix (wHTH) protein
MSWQWLNVNFILRENKSNVKVPLYVFSRFNDLKERKQIVFSKNEIISKCWIVTNNRFTSDAIAFAKCSGMNLLLGLSERQ